MYFVLNVSAVVNSRVDCFAKYAKSRSARMILQCMCIVTTTLVPKLSLCFLHKVYYNFLLGFGQNKYYIDGTNAHTADFSAPDVWKWSDGTIINMNSTFWAPERPNTPSISHCLIIEGGSKNWKFNDEECADICNFICEM